ncbi:LruC domain-containing protein [Cyclonatronum proteinivorum]|uniref:LruC domain-containing protein n=1 Tax=Cyclonatronum proteinivorum TaxID=1457365 RepID=A0A345UP47_9BACT|nr:LruC domain-containing protein [Cyclonatronum proteinivorum]AXJ02249.1 LruC domain-containing protein [Cyclonatronum proteinivorum]
MKKITYIVLAMLAGAGLVACNTSLSPSGEEDVRGINVPYNFDFSTTGSVNFTVKAASQNAADMNRGRISVFDAHPDQGGRRLATYFLNDSGELAIEHSLPTHLKSVFILPDHPAAEPVQIQVRNGVVQYEYNLPQVAGRGLDAGNAGIAAGLMDDPAGTVRNVFPAEDAFGTIMFEDLWPSFGDYDMNDLVIGYQFSELTNEENNILSIDMIFQIRATGTAVKAGFGIQFDDLFPDDIEEVVGTRLNAGSFIVLNPNGTEAEQSRAVVIAFDDANQNFPRMGNVFAGSTERTPDEVALTVTFENPVSREVLGNAPYNPFAFFHGTKNVIVDGDTTAVPYGGRGQEVHLPDHVPTDLVFDELFGQYEDNSLAGMFYKSTNVARVGDNMNFAISVPELIPHAIQKARFASAIDGEEHAYLRFARWAETDGVENADWYLDIPEYRDLDVLFGTAVPEPEPEPED